jgi:hypothetical protein
MRCDMRIIDLTLGDCDIDIELADSVVDVYVSGGYSNTMERDLHDIELDLIQELYAELIAQYAWESGRCINHN